MIELKRKDGERTITYTVDNNDMTIWELAEHLELFLLAIGYHPDNVKEVFTQDSC